MGAVDAGIKRRLRLGRVVAPRHAIAAVAEPRASAIPAEGAGELPSVAGARLVGAGHGSSSATVGLIALKSLS
jgi:hypothetical protein